MPAEPERVADRELRTVAERLRLRATREAWASTWRATKASGITIVIELAGALVVAVAWVVALVVR